MERWARQDGFGVTFDWGPAGARELARAGGAVVIVDVLSFTTAVSVAVERGTRVHPYPWRGAGAAAYAARVGAELAVGRGAVTGQAPWSLSPAALLRAPRAARLVLPSPNGSAIARATGSWCPPHGEGPADATGAGSGPGPAGAGPPGAGADAAGAPRPAVLTACLRDRSAVARYLARCGYGTAERPVAVIAAGEKWPDGSLRPAVEDLLGAGAVLAALRDAGAGARWSPEALTAAAAYAGTPDPAAALTGSASGRELAERGFGDDVAVAGAVDATTTVPLLREEAFGPAD